MKQVQLDYRSGAVTVEETPVPVVQPGTVLVHNRCSLISQGTERASQQFASRSLLGKARSRPDLVKQVVTKARRDGLIATYKASMNKLTVVSPVGYSSAGTVSEVGYGSHVFAPGDLVACAGGGYANHSEVISVPKNLIVKVPKGVPAEEAAFTTLGAIALQGVRIGDVSLGDWVAVIGLGLVGQLTVQVAKAAGAKVLAIDLNPYRVELANKLGADVATLRSGAEEVANEISDGYGIDVVLLTASTKANDPIEMASTIAREKGKVVVVGDVGLDVPRSPYYIKELDLRFSRSYGPGRYDPEYEEKGNDYPYGYVRWTEQRNMSAFLDLIKSGKVVLNPLITHRFPIERAPDAYKLIQEESGEEFLGVILEYPEDATFSESIVLDRVIASVKTDILQLGLIGAGEFARSILIPAIKSVPNISMKGVITSSGLTAAFVSRKFGIPYSTSSLDQLLSDDEIDCVVIATRHNLHAAQVIAALNAGKHVFVEKPLALTEKELASILKTLQERPRQLLVGYNRRFAPLALKMKEFFPRGHKPLVATYRVNSGSLPNTHWTQDLSIGGGRIIGEACHFIDFMQFLIGANPRSVYAKAVGTKNNAWNPYDETILNIEFTDGSVCSIVYASGGDTSYSKERIEVFGDGRVAILDDFRSLELIDGGRRQKIRSRPPGDKGHKSEMKTFMNTIMSDSAPPIPLEDMVATTLTTFRAIESIRSGDPKMINHEEFIESTLSDLIFREGKI